MVQFITERLEYLKTQRDKRYYFFTRLLWSIIVFGTSLLILRNTVEASDFETKYKMRGINNKIGTLCDGFLNGTYLIAIKGEKLFAIKHKEHGDWAGYQESYDFDDIGFVHFEYGVSVFISFTTGNKIRIKISELEGVLR